MDLVCLKARTVYNT